MSKWLPFLKEASKPLSPAQKRARERNWGKATISAACGQASLMQRDYPLVPEERFILLRIMRDYDMLLEHWDENHKRIIENERKA